MSRSNRGRLGGNRERGIPVRTTSYSEPDRSHRARNAVVKPTRGTSRPRGARPSYAEPLLSSTCTLHEVNV